MFDALRNHHSCLPDLLKLKLKKVRNRLNSTNSTPLEAAESLVDCLMTPVN